MQKNNFRDTKKNGARISSSTKNFRSDNTKRVSKNVSRFGRLNLRAEPIKDAFNLQTSKGKVKDKRIVSGGRGSGRVPCMWVPDGIQGTKKVGTFSLFWVLDATKKIPGSFFGFLGACQRPRAPEKVLGAILPCGSDLGALSHPRAPAKNPGALPSTFCLVSEALFLLLPALFVCFSGANTFLGNTLFWVRPNKKRFFDTLGI